MMTPPMQNTHLEHPEDAILTGDLSVLDWFSEPHSFISTKIDGAPAVVWGTNPSNGKFFVGTKAVFNKKKIRIAHSHDEIDAYYDGKVNDILHQCFKYLPRTTSIIQGDWIGYGGSDVYRPNTITYVFSEMIAQSIIIAPHTVYGGGDDLRTVSASPMMFEMPSTNDCMFVQPEVTLHSDREDIADICQFARQMSTLCDFVTQNKAMKIKRALNECVRMGWRIDENVIADNCDCDVNLIRLWKLVASIKDDMFMFIKENDVIGCMIGEEPSSHEGYVITNKYGMFKIVDRDEFSRANFVLEKTWG